MSKQSHPFLHGSHSDATGRQSACTPAHHTPVSIASALLISRGHLGSIATHGLISSCCGSAPRCARVSAGTAAQPAMFGGRGPAAARRPAGGPWGARGEQNHGAGGRRPSPGHSRGEEARRGSPDPSAGRDGERSKCSTSFFFWPPPSWPQRKRRSSSKRRRQFPADRCSSRRRTPLPDAMFPPPASR